MNLLRFGTPKTPVVDPPDEVLDHPNESDTPKNQPLFHEPEKQEKMLKKISAINVDSTVKPPKIKFKE
jgi:hypothetical protein